MKINSTSGLRKMTTMQSGVLAQADSKILDAEFTQWGRSAADSIVFDCLQKLNREVFRNV